MSEKAKPISKEAALAALHKRAGLHNDSRRRFHVEGKELTVTKIRILESNLCANCVHVVVEASPDPHHQSAHLKHVSVVCRKKINIIDLYQQTPLGVSPTCVLFQSKK